MRVGFVAVCACACVCALFAAAPRAAAQAQNEPHLGYVYPAGLQRGCSAEVLIGGQFLKDASGVRLTGTGIQAEVVGYYKPLDNEERGALRRKLRELARRQAGETVVAEAADPDEVPIPPLPGVPDLERLDAAGRELLARRYLDPRKQQNMQLADTVVVRLVADFDAPPGPRELRLITPAGASNPLRFEVGIWPEVVEAEPNERDGDRGTLVTLPLVANGQILPGDVDRFRFRADRGWRVVAAVSARALTPYLADAVPGWFQATLALYDAEGHELAFADDFRFQPDPVLAFEIPRSGEYLLEIRDAIYRGRDDFVYRIALGELPWLTRVFPLGAADGARAAVNVGGWNLPEEWLVLEPAAAESGPRQLQVGAGVMRSNPLPFAVGTLPEATESEPNDGASAAEELELPRVVNGRIDPPGDRDCFRFRGRAGQLLVAEVEARRLGSPLDSLLRLRGPGGEVLALSDDAEDPAAGLLTHHADSRLLVKLPRAGEFVLELGDALGQGGADFGYRLRIGPPEPDFALRVTPSAINVPAGGAAVVNVHALRRDGFDGVIELALGGAAAAAGFVLSGARIPEGRDMVRMTLSAPEGRRAGPVPIELIGTGRVRGRPQVRAAVPADDCMQAFLYRHLVPAEELLASVVRAGGTRTPLRFDGDGPVRLALGNDARVRLLGAVRELPPELRIELSAPPPGISVGEVSLEKGGVGIVLHADRKTAEAGWEGNLILEAWVERRSGGRDGQPEQVRRQRLGYLPAVPVEIVKL